MSLKLKNVISKEEDLTLPIPESTTSDEIDLVIVSINNHLDEMDGDLQVIDNDCNTLDETIMDIEELEGLKTVVEEQLIEDEEYTGLDIVSSELLRIKLRSINRRRGIDTSRLEGIFSSESFGSNVRNRRYRTEVSMEGLMSMLKGLWDKIKKVISMIWEGLKNFWKKHFTILGSLEVELEKLKKKIKNKSGHPDASKVIKTPDKMLKMYRPKGNLTIQEVGIMTARMEDSVYKASKYLEKVLDALKAAMGKLGKDTDDAEFIKEVPPAKMLIRDGELGSKEDPLINGMYATMDMETIGESEFYTIEFNWEEADPIKYHSTEMILPSKDDCVKLIDGCLVIVKRAKKFGEIFQAYSSATTSTLNKLTNLVNSVRDDDSGSSGGSKEREPGETIVTAEKGQPRQSSSKSEVKSNYRNVLKFYQDVMKIMPKLNNKMIKACLDTIRTDIKYLKMTVGALVDDKK